MTKALITGITGQEGSYLAYLLVKKGYKVHGIIRPEIKGIPENSLKLFEKIYKKTPRLISDVF